MTTNNRNLRDDTLFETVCGYAAHAVTLVVFWTVVSVVYRVIVALVS